MTLYRKRESFSGLSVKIGTYFAKLGISPNQWTLISLLPAAGALYYILEHNFLIAAGLLLIASFIDLVDGSVARVMGKTTKLGAYLDTIVDRYIEFLVILGLVFAGLPGFYVPAYVWIFVYIFGAMMTTYAKAAAFEKGLSSDEIKGGLLERAERMIILFIGIVLAHYSRMYLTYIIALLAVLSNLTAIQRIRIAVKLSRK